MRSARFLPAVLCLIVFVAKVSHAAPAANTAPAAAPAPTAPAPAGGADIYKKDLSSVIYIEKQAKDGKTYDGSGFMAIKDGIAVTCWHMVHDAKSVTARFSDGEVYDVVGLIDHDAINDVALVKLKESGRPLLALQKDAPEIGAKAYVIGAPLGQYDFTISDGIISQIRHDPYQYQFTCPATHGNSGGPLLDENGQVVGIVQGGVDQTTANLGFAVPIKYALNLDETQPVTVWKDVKDDTPGDEDTSSSTSDDDLDKSLALTYRDTSDTGSLMLYLILSLTDKNFQGVPAHVYALQERLKTDLTGLSSASSDDTEKEHLRKTLMDQAQHCADMLGYYVEMVQTAQNGGTSAQVSDLFNRLTAAAENLPKLSDDDKKALFASQAVQNAIPDVVAERQDKNPFQLGDDSTFADPLFVCSVQPGSFADKLGLRMGDLIMSVDGQKPTDMMNVRDLVQKDAGKKVVVTVARGKKTVDLKGDVPASAAVPLAPASPPAPSQPAN